MRSPARHFARPRPCSPRARSGWAYVFRSDLRAPGTYIAGSERSSAAFRACIAACAAAACLAAAACRPGPPRAAAPIVQPGAPGDAPRAIGAAQASDTSGVRYTAADVRFVQGMIGHHAQALDMTALVPSRTTRPDLRLLAKRIDVSQRDEIGMMEAWLTHRGEAVPGPHAHHGGGAALMPGMLTQEQMAQLAAATGPAFETLFLEYMIQHHQGALTMVKELFATPGAGQEADIFAFASDVDSDQRMEIDRMTAMLEERAK